MTEGREHAGAYVAEDRGECVSPSLRILDRPGSGFGEAHLLIEGRGYLILGRNADSETNGGMDVDYEYSGMD